MCPTTGSLDIECVLCRDTYHVMWEHPIHTVGEVAPADHQEVHQDGILVGFRTPESLFWSCSSSPF